MRTLRLILQQGLPIYYAVILFETHLAIVSITYEISSCPIFIGRLGNNL